MIKGNEDLISYDAFLPVGSMSQRMSADTMEYEIFDCYLFGKVLSVPLRSRFSNGK